MRLYPDGGGSMARDLETEELLSRTRAGDPGARSALLVRHYPRLRRMIAVHLDPRLAARVDPTDVVQETVAEACRKLPEYLARPPLPFYPWLRQIAWERLQKLHLRHITAAKRSVRREAWPLWLPDHSALELIAGVAGPSSSPLARLARGELLHRVREALERLPERDRQVLVLRYLEDLSMKEIAAVLASSEGAVKVRHLRALRKLRSLLRDVLGEEVP